MEDPKPLTSVEASKLLNEWRSKPQTYFYDILGVEKMWKLQDQLLDTLPIAIEEHKPIFMGSGHALGKDFICAGISLWFLHSYSPSISIQTAPTDRQVRKIMWGDTLTHWRNKKIDLGGTPYANPYLEIRKDDWYLIGFTTKETGASSVSGGGKFSGYHSENMCIIVSESQAVEEKIYDQIDGVAASADNCLIIYIGNPTTAKGRFAKGLRDPVNNIVFNFSCLENPNYIHKKILIPGLATYEWVEDKRRKWGPGDPRWVGRVLGQIPDVAINSVLGQSDIKMMESRWGFLAQHSINAGVSVDPAGEGIDDNVLLAGKGGEVVKKYKKANMPPSETAMLAVEMCKEVFGNFVIIDCDGIGIAVWQEAMKLPEKFTYGIQIVKFHGSARLPLDLKKENNYLNKRTEAAFVTQRRARAGRAAIDPSWEEMKEDLTEPMWFEKNGYIMLEEKADIKERLLRSPGEGDAFNMLQYGFEQNYSNIDYSNQQTSLPQYALTNATVLAGDRPPESKSLSKGYGIVTNIG